MRIMTLLSTKWSIREEKCFSKKSGTPGTINPFTANFGSVFHEISPTRGTVCER